MRHLQAVGVDIYRVLNDRVRVVCRIKTKVNWYKIRAEYTNDPEIALGV